MAQDREAMERGELRLGELQDAFLSRPGVDRGRMFSTEGLRVRGRIFAVVDHSGGLMVKVPEARVDELVDTGAAERVVMRGRGMREWATMPYERGVDAWRALLEEAHAHLDAITPR